ncbi:NAD-dependent epimerase/dehydratase family protein [Legionella gresilensis]|uniref:NAD-dependent epimerase/dehydratase family protein n=1 Tax=Legionella gresilensis TaxID=91823 RepID=UPI001040FCEA|nr:NAD-dependent epimerase/dehydratase family protein [Legionella gresilensis]
MKILILGGTNLVGPYLIDYLIKEYHEVILFNRGKTNNHLFSSLTKVVGERRHLSQYKKTLQNFEPDVVVDMLAMTQSDAEQLLDVFTGVAKKLIIISSIDVYLAHEFLWEKQANHCMPMPLKEDALLRQEIFPYKKYTNDKNELNCFYSKIQVENVIEQAPISSTILRFPFVYGPGDYLRLMPYLQDILQQKKEILLDNRKAQWRCTRGFAKDMALAIVKALFDHRVGKFVYNVGEQEPLTELQWLKNIATSMNWCGQIIEKEKIALPNHLQDHFNWQQDIIVDTRKIRQELDYQETTIRGQALKSTLQWAIANINLE